MIDLHCHLDGSISLEIAKELAKLQKLELPAKNDDQLQKKLSVSSDCESLNDFLKCFDLPLTLLQTKEGIRQAVFLVQEKFRKEGLFYLELRFAPQLHLTKGLSQEEVILSALEGLKLSSLHTNLILCCMRTDNKLEENLETVRLAKKYLVEDNGVVAIDLAGAEALYKTSAFEREFELAKKEGIPFTIHAGEADGANSVKTALKFGAKRIGHGVRIYEDAELVDFIIKNKIPLEMCPTSNRQTKAVEDMKAYPLKEYLSKGIKVTLNTDDPAICGTSLKNEFSYIEKMYGISDEQKKVILQNSIEAAFCSQEYKTEMKKLLLEERL